MKDKQVIVTTSWDDGHKLDLRLAKLLKKYNIKGTFYVSPKDREFKQEDLLTDKEILGLSKDFEIGAHTMTHPRLTKVNEEEAFKEISESKKYLENLTGKEIKSFCYPGGNYNKNVKELVKKAGFSYARTMKRFSFNISRDVFSSETSLETHRNSLITLPIDFMRILKFSKFNPLEAFRNLNWEHLAKKMFDRTLENGGVYHLWGHSWVVDNCDDWDKLERVLEYISNKSNVKYLTNSEIIGGLKK